MKVFDASRMPAPFRLRAMPRRCRRRASPGSGHTPCKCRNPGGNHHLVSKHRKGLPMGLILLIFLIVLLMGGLPTWGYSRNWGYGPSSGLGLVLIVVLVLVLMGHIPRGF